MKILRKIGYKEKLISAFSILTILIVISVYFVALFNQKSTINKSIILTSSSFINIICRDCKANIEDKNSAKIQTIMDSLVQNQTISYINLYNENGKIIYSAVSDTIKYVEAQQKNQYNLLNIEDPKIFNFARDYYDMIYPLKNQTGFARIGLYFPDAAAELRINHDYYLALFFIFLVLAISMALLLSGSLKKPIERLVHFAEEIGKGNLNFSMNIDSSDEFAVLGNSFATMAQKLEKTHQQLIESQKSLENLAVRQSHVLIESEEKYRNLVETSNNLIILIQNSRIIFSNNKIDDYLRKEVSIQNCHIKNIPFFEENDRINLDKELDLIPENEEKVYTFELNGYDKHDNKKIFELNINRIKFNNLPAFQGVIRDITERKNLEKELLQYQKIESLFSITGGIAHDFNNIIGTLIPKAEYIKEISDNNSEVEQEADKIISACNNAAELVTNLINFSRKEELSKADINPNDLIIDSLQFLESSLQKNIKIQTKLTDQEIILSLDKNQIRQVLINLILNARDALPDGGIINIETKIQSSPTFHFPSEKKLKHFIIQVRDNGIGIDDKVIKRIFDPFFTTKEQGKGTGLGLSTVYRNVKSHNGDIYVASKTGKGTTFTITLPLEDKQFPSQEKPEQKHQNTGILIVEDDEMMLETISKLLELRKFKTFTAANGFDAIDILQTHLEMIEFALIDLGLPVLSGIDTIKKLKEIKPELKFIVTSGYLDDKKEREVNSVTQIFAFLKKPFKTDEILNVISR